MRSSSTSATSSRCGRTIVIGRRCTAASPMPTPSASARRSSSIRRTARDYAPLPSMIDAGIRPRYRPINWGEFRARRTAGDYAESGRVRRRSAITTVSNSERRHGVHRHHPGVRASTTTCARCTRARKRTGASCRTTRRCFAIGRRSWGCGRSCRSASNVTWTSGASSSSPSPPRNALRSTLCSLAHGKALTEFFSAEDVQAIARGEAPPSLYGGRGRDDLVRPQGRARCVVRRPPPTSSS